MKKYSIPKKLQKKFNKYYYKGHKTYYTLFLEKDSHCSFYRSGRCQKYNARPFDCRIYPVVPIFKKNQIKLSLGKKCPLVRNRKVSKKFIKNVYQALTLINPSQWWKEFYNF